MTSDRGSWFGTLVVATTMVGSMVGCLAALGFVCRYALDDGGADWGHLAALLALEAAAAVTGMAIAATLADLATRFVVERRGGLAGPPGRLARAVATSGVVAAVLLGGWIGVLATIEGGAIRQGLAEAVSIAAVAIGGLLAIGFATLATAPLAEAPGGPERAPSRGGDERAVD